MFDVPSFRGSRDFEYHDQLKESLLARRHQFCVPDNIFNGTGYSTIRSQNLLHNEYPYFRDYLESCIRPYDDKLVITNCWVNINGHGGYQHRHNHAGWDFVGTYYLQVPEDKLRHLARLMERARELEKSQKAQENFMDFVDGVWPEFIGGRHHKIIAEKFEKLARGEIKRLIINMPPRHTKSEFASYLLH